GYAGFTSTAIGASPGTISLRSPRRLASNAPQKAHARDIASGSIEAFDDAGLDGIGGTDEHDWDRGGRSLRRLCRFASADGKDQDNAPVNQIGRQRRQPILATFRRAIFDQN